MISSGTKRALAYIAVASGVVVLGKIFKSITEGTPITSLNGFTGIQKFPELMNAILHGESKGYDDHNFYTGSRLNSYIRGGYGKPYGMLTHNLSAYTIGDVIAMQSNPASSQYGRLFATGRYQIIPATLKGTYKEAGLKLSDKYSQENQDKIGMYLLTQKRPEVGAYLFGKVPDTEANLKKAALGIAMEWSSVGVPYPINGKATNQSFYSGDVASTDTNVIQKLLKSSRK